MKGLGRGKGTRREAAEGMRGRECDLEADRGRNSSFKSGRDQGVKRTT